MRLKSLYFLTLTLLSGFLNSLKAQPEKCILFSVNKVLLYVDMKKVAGGQFGEKCGYTPDKMQDELSRELASVPVEHFSAYIGVYPTLVEAWQTGFLSNDTVYKKSLEHVESAYGPLHYKRFLLKQALDYACTEKQATVFSPFQDSLDLARRCKNTTCAIALCTSWNKELFENLMRVHKESLAFFDEQYISGNCGVLASTPAFYNPIVTKYGNNIVLVDVLAEDIRAAHAQGIKTILHTSAAATERELKEMGFLS